MYPRFAKTGTQQMARDRHSADGQMGIHKIRLSISTTYTCPPAHTPLHPPMPVWVWVRVQGANSFVCAPKCESMLLVGSAVSRWRRGAHRERA